MTSGNTSNLVYFCLFLIHFFFSSESPAPIIFFKEKQNCCIYDVRKNEYLILLHIWFCYDLLSESFLKTIRKWLYECISVGSGKDLADTIWSKAEQRKEEMNVSHDSIYGQHWGVTPTDLLSTEINRAFHLCWDTNL